MLPALQDGIVPESIQPASLKRLHTAASTKIRDCATVSTEPPLLVDAYVERFTLGSAAHGPLQGATFAVKDVFDVAGRHTACGNPVWRATHAPARVHATAVQRLLNAGAALVGKTRTDELAYALDGNNVHEGAPLNPLAPERLTGGSSSGSASAVAAGDVDFALATDTAGSVRVPAAWCGIIGLRPTHARVAVDGLNPLAPSFDTVGWLARSGTVMAAVGGVLLEGSTAAAAELELVVDTELDRGGGADFAANRRAAMVHLEASFAAVGAVALGVDLAAAAECLRVLQAAEVWGTHGAWIDASQPRFGPGIAERIAAAREITRASVREAARMRAHLIAYLDQVMPVGRVLCLPAVPGPAPLRDSSPAALRSQRARLLPLAALASLTGRPQLSLPFGRSDGAPLGISLLGWRHGDEALLRIAAVLP